MSDPKLLETACGIIAHVSGTQSKEWQDAAQRWLDAYLSSLGKYREEPLPSVSEMKGILAD